MLSVTMFEAHENLQNLRNYLNDKCILPIGCGYPDWLSRFILCLIKGPDVARKPATVALMADAQLSQCQGDFCAFLARLGNASYRDGDAVAFVSELHRRWQERTPEASATRAREVLIEPWRDHAFFISYASEDREAALHLYAGLRANHFDAWLDKADLEPGETYRKTIFRKINRASFVLAIVSKQSAAGTDNRFYRAEWEHSIGEDQRRHVTYDWDRLIIPVRIDDVPCDDPGIPAYFAENKHWLDLPGGELTEKAANNLNRSLEAYRQHMRHEGVNL